MWMDLLIWIHMICVRSLENHFQLVIGFQYLLHEVHMSTWTLDTDLQWIHSTPVFYVETQIKRKPRNVFSYMS
jgi:hypothetical protein